MKFYFLVKELEMFIDQMKKADKKFFVMNYDEEYGISNKGIKMSALDAFSGEYGSVVVDDSNPMFNQYCLYKNIVDSENSIKNGKLIRVIIETK